MVKRTKHEQHYGIGGFYLPSSPLEDVRRYFGERSKSPSTECYDLIDTLKASTQQKSPFATWQALAATAEPLS